MCKCREFSGNFVTGHLHSAHLLSPGERGMALVAPPSINIVMFTEEEEFSHIVNGAGKSQNFWRQTYTSCSLYVWIQNNFAAVGTIGKCHISNVLRE